ncbi:hypothetical protein GW17_00006008 [Ensete ventricosum]|nr:hypothetical protein GW17_00006008 [Ensete ventricosum]
MRDARDGRFPVVDLPAMALLAPSKGLAFASASAASVVGRRPSGSRSRSARLATGPPCIHTDAGVVQPKGFSHTAEATEEAASPRFSALRNLAKAPSAVRLRVRCDLAAIFAGVSPEENDGFAIEDVSHSQASSSTATLGAPSQPRSILPLLPNRGNISSRPLAAAAVDSTVADHIHSRRATPPVILGIRGLQPQQHSRCFPQTTGSLFYRQNRRRLPYWNLFTLPAAPKSNPNADTTAASPRTSAASPRTLPPPSLCLRVCRATSAPATTLHSPFQG